MLVTTLWATLFGCAPPVPGTYVGLLGSIPSEIGMVLNDGGGRAYVAGSSDTIDRHHTWIDLKIDGLKVHGEADKLTIDASWKKGDRWEGKMIDTDSTAQVFIAFAAADTKDDQLSGVYEAESESVCPVGAIISDGGTKLQGVYCFADETYAPLVPVGEALELTGDTVAVQTDTDPAVAVELTRALP